MIVKIEENSVTLIAETSHERDALMKIVNQSVEKITRDDAWDEKRSGINVPVKFTLRDPNKW